MPAAAIVNRFQLPLVLTLLAYAPQAAAYIDPNLGLLAIQGIVAAFGAVLIAMRSVRERILSLLRRLFRRPRDARDTDPPRDA